ncbi:mandelate racemase/muconate lactonizing enzyme family protein [uncultured Cohaesibacter sp.]|uniref:mandelate racemase/muconate lactonizing enzyme family protein n=1 Tax=uncultured Cohaesibacter sp. TaxID=1002546 RepID=UPI0029C8355C|nr:mandelate racemase/muconate lactonizing enzyme family protein [uncultured Cohaesibacter sp.]
MSVIKSISTYSHINDLQGRVWNPAIRWTQKHAIFIEVESDDGFIGLGEAWCFDTAPDCLLAYIATEVVPAFLGRDIADLETISDALLRRATLTSRHGILSSALSAFDIACHDIRAKAADKPLHQHLSTDGSGTVQLYASGGLYGQDKDVNALVHEMTGFAQKGYQTVKMKIGALDLREDLVRVKAVLDALPDDHRVIIDAVYSYTPQVALEMFEALPHERIEAFQAPVRADDITGMAWLVKQGVPVMAVEAEYRPELHKAMIDEDAVRFLQTAPIACGGASRVSTLSKSLQGTPIRLSLEVSSTAVALMAACQMAAADPSIAHVEYHTIHDVFYDRLSLSPVGKGGSHKLSDKPGLGISLPHNEVRHVANYKP